MNIKKNQFKKYIDKMKTFRKINRLNSSIHLVIRKSQTHNPTLKSRGFPKNPSTTYPTTTSTQTFSKLHHNLQPTNQPTNPINTFKPNNNTIPRNPPPIVFSHPHSIETPPALSWHVLRYIHDTTPTFAGGKRDRWIFQHRGPEKGGGIGAAARSPCYHL